MKKYIKKKGVQRLLWILVFLTVWEASVKLCGISPLLLPPVEEVLKTLIEDIIHGKLLFQSLSSIGLIFSALVISAAAALLLAMLSRMGRLWESLVDTLTVIAHPLPGLALLPLIIIWFGTGYGAVLAIVVHSALWPLLLNLITGFSSVPGIYTDTGKNLSMSEIFITLEIRIPASAPYLISGLKTGWARGWRAFISAEMVFGSIGGNGGIGWYIFKQRTFMNTAGLFAGIIIVIAIGIFVENVLFEILEKNTIRKWGNI